MHGSDFGRSVDLRPRGSDTERVALVLVDGLDGCGGVVDLDYKTGCPGNAAASMPQSSGHLDASHGAVDRIHKASVGDAGNFDGES